MTLSLGELSSPAMATKGKGESSKKAYLIWDEGFGSKFLASLVCIAGSVAACARVNSLQQLAWELYQELLFQLMDCANRMAWWSVIGLLSSSCCALQLLLNALNFGCAGFNTVLGPIRPFLCALTVCIQGAVWNTALDKPFQLLYVAPCTLIAVVLTLLPELTAMWVSRGKGSGSSALEVQSSAVLAVEGMGCAACTKKVAEVLDRLPVVLGREISLERKETTVFLAASEANARQEILPELIAGIKDAGFEASLSSLIAAGQDKSGSSKPTTPAPSSEKVVNADGCCDWPRTAQLTGGGVGGMIVSIAAGLLGSSCCLLQLGVNLLATLNLVHVGCAGFNKVLGPWRTLLRSGTAAWLAASWCLCIGKRWPRMRAWRLLAQTALCLLLTFLPEILLWSGGPAMAPSLDGAQMVKVKVDGMGCEACQLHVQGLMERTGGVVSSSVDFKAGEAELSVAKDWSFDFQEMAQRLEREGYSARLHSDL